MDDGVAHMNNSPMFALVINKFKKKSLPTQFLSDLQFVHHFSINHEFLFFCSLLAVTQPGPNLDNKKNRIYCN